MNAEAVPESTSPGPGEEAQRESLAELNQSLRALMQNVRVCQANPAVLNSARETIDEVNTLLAPHAHAGPFAQARLDGASPNDLPHSELAEIFPFSPLVGPLNPLAPPIRLYAVEGVVHGVAVWGAPYCGPPNHVHGGIIAAAFDELLGAVNVINGSGAMTGTLTIRYRNPIPLNQEIRMEGHCSGSEGRKVFSSGKMWLGDSLLAEAEGIFIQLAGDFRTELIARGTSAAPPDTGEERP